MRAVLTLDRLRAMDADEAAALLLHRHMDGAAELDAPVLTQWLSLSAANAVAWEDARAAWADFDGGEDDEILAALRVQARRAGPKRSRWWPAATAAAALIVVAVGATSTIFLQRPAAEHPSALAFATGAGETRDFQLADGSRMRLDADSAATASLAAARRDVRVRRGHVTFDVAHDVARPFVVAAGDQEVVALGTRFGVTLTSDVVSVVLMEGRVSVRRASGAGAPVILRPGQQLVARRGQAPLVSAAADKIGKASADDMVAFDNVTLGEAAKVFSGHGGGQLIVRDPAVAALRISGRFNARDLPRFGRSLALLHPVKLVKRGPDTWEIVARR